MNVHRWWESDLDEVYWMEITGRANLGADLNAPQLDESGKESPGYSLITEPRDGDIVFHYHLQHQHRDRSGIVAWSRIIGGVWADQVRWRSHAPRSRTSAREPYLRDGWRRGIVDFMWMTPGVTQAELQGMRDTIRHVRLATEAKHGKPIYFPFYDYAGSELRPNQLYIAKVPKDLVEIFPAMLTAAEEARRTCGTPAVPSPSAVVTGDEVGREYIAANEELAVSQRDPWTVDPSIVERGAQGHAKTQNALANFLRAQGIEPVSPLPGQPAFDAAWATDGALFVAEVKSVTDANEERQLRLGLGQVLRYNHLLSRGGRTVRPVLVIERAPSDSSWCELCSSHGVTLVWPEVLQRLTVATSS